MTQVVEEPGTARRTPQTTRHARPGASTNVLHRFPALSPLIVLILACIVFGLANGRFFRPENLSIVLQQAAVVGSLAVGQTLIILTAGIDLSIGAVMVLSSLVMAKLVNDNGAPAILALLGRFRRRVIAANDQRPSGHPAQAAAVHRHAGNVEHLHGDHPDLCRWADHLADRQRPADLDRVDDRRGRLQHHRSACS